METLEQTGAYTYPPICTNKLIFGKGFFFFISFFLNMLPNLTILQILMFVTSHVSPLL